MSFHDSQNPGIGGLDELTDAETLVIQQITALGDPGADRILFWDESANAYAFLTAGSGLTITGTTITASAAGVSGTINEIAYFDSGTSISSLPVATYPSLTELSYVKGVTSAIQTQLNGKQASGSYLTSANIVATITNGVTTNAPSEDAVFDALALKAPLASPVFTGTLTIPVGLTGVLRADTGVVSVDSDVTDIVAAGTSSAAGKLELATDAETVTGTDTARATTPANITAKLAAPGTIGNTTPSSATFTTVTINTGITLAENASLALDPAGSADGKYTGVTVTGTAGTTLAFGDLIYLAVADSRWELADADAATTSDRMLGICVLAAAADGNATTILLHGLIRADAAFPALTIGAAVYVGETAGDIQVAIPTGADNVIRRVGYAMTADEIYFNPSMDSQITVA